MKKESLIKAREIIISSLNSEKDIDLIDKTELMININKLLDPQEYDNSIAILQKEKVKKYGQTCLH